MVGIRVRVRGRVTVRVRIRIKVWDKRLGLLISQIRGQMEAGMVVTLPSTLFPGAVPVQGYACSTPSL